MTHPSFSPPTRNADGREVLQAKFVSGGKGGEDGWIVVCALPDNPHHPWVTWWLRHRDLITVQGHYFKTLAEAQQDFDARR